MTPEERDGALSELVIAYSDNLRTIAALRSRLRGVGSHLQAIGAALADTPERVDEDNGAIVVHGQSDGHRLLDADVDGGSLRDAVRDFQAAHAKDACMVTDLEEAGLSNLVRRERPP